MAQPSNTNLQGIPAFSPNHNDEPPTNWSNWIDQFHLAIIVEENIDIDNQKDPVKSETDIPILEGAQNSETEIQRKAREVRSKEVMKFYENAEDKRIAEKRKLGGIRRLEADK